MDWVRLETPGGTGTWKRRLDIKKCNHCALCAPEVRVDARNASTEPLVLRIGLETPRPGAPEAVFEIQRFVPAIISRRYNWGSLLGIEGRTRLIAGLRNAT